MYSSPSPLPNKIKWWKYERKYRENSSSVKNLNHEILPYSKYRYRLSIVNIF